MESDKFKLGLFIIVSFLVICTLFVVFGLFDYGSRKAPMTTLFSESVQGLESGSLVKLRGVPIGKVRNITISMEDKLIRVDMDINISKVNMRPVGKLEHKKITEADFYAMMLKEISSGLRARLEMSGITGGKYIEFDYHQSDVPEEPDSNMPRPGFDSSGVFFMPSEPSMLAGLRSSVSEIVAKIASVDYKGISEKLEKVLENTNSLISDPSLKQMLHNSDELSARLTVTVANLNKALTEERLQKISEEASQTLANLQALTAKMQVILEEAKVKETTSSFREAADSVSDARKSMKNTLAKLNDTLDSVDELIRTLEENPRSIISGKAIPDKP